MTALSKLPEKTIENQLRELKEKGKCNIMRIMLKKWNIF